MENQLTGLKYLVIGADKDVGFDSAVALLKGGAHTVYIQGLSKSAANITAEKLNNLAKENKWPGVAALFREGNLFDDFDDSQSSLEQLKETSGFIVNTSAPMDFCAYLRSKGLKEDDFDARLRMFAENVENMLETIQDSQEEHCRLNVIFLGNYGNIDWYNPDNDYSDSFFSYYVDDMDDDDELKSSPFLVVRADARSKYRRLSMNIIKHGYLVSNNILSCHEGLTKEDLSTFFKDKDRRTFFSSVELENIICVLASKPGNAIKNSTINLGGCSDDMPN